MSSLCGLNCVLDLGLSMLASGELFQKSPYVYDEDVFKARDFVLSEARKYKIRLILSLRDNWEEYGSKAQHVKWEKWLA